MSENKNSTISTTLLNTSGGDIGSIDTANGVFTPIFTGGSAWGDIALSPTTKELFANTTSDAISLGEQNPDKLYKIDTTTGQATLIGDLGVTNMFGLEFGTDGVLYGTSQKGGFYSINTNTGKATLIANIPNFSAAGDLTFSSASQQFLATSTTPDNTTLFGISTNGAAKEVGDIGFADVLGVLFDSGKLLGYTRNGSEIKINQNTGTGSFVQNVPGLTGQVFGATAPISLDFRNVSLLNTSGGDIGVIDPVSGAFTPLFTGGSAWGDIALSPTTKELFANTTSDAIPSGEQNPDKLFKIDTTTGKETLIGDLGVKNMFGMEFGPDGKLYGTSQGGGFYNIDTSTGRANLIATIPNFSAAGDLTFNPLSQEFLATSTTPGNSTLFGISTNGNVRKVGDIGFDDVLGVQFDRGKFLGYTRVGEEIEINPNTGAGKLIQDATGLTGQVFGVTSLKQLLPITTSPIVSDSSITIKNPSFEEPVLKDDTFTTTPPPGWQLFNPFGLIPKVITGDSSAAGAFNPPKDNYPNGIPDGQNVGYVFLTDKPGSGFAGLQQTLDTVVAANTRYTLTVDVGNPAGVDSFSGLDFTGFPGYRSVLLAGDEIVAVDDNSLKIEDGKFATSTVSFTAAPGESFIGKNLTIRLNNPLTGEGVEVDFDNVRLKAQAVTASAVTENQTLFGSSGTTTINGSLGNDIIFGNGLSTTLFGRDGNDQLFGASTDDYINGGTGNDILFGNGGKDILFGEAGDDVIFGGSQSDSILAGAGNDTIYGNGGHDSISGGTGFNTIFLGQGKAIVALTAGEGFDTINNFQLGSTRLFAGSLLNDLSFADSSAGVRISAGNDLLAVVSNQSASTFSSNLSAIFNG